MGAGHIAAAFPALLDKGFEITSPMDPTYNCIAFAAGDVERCWWPGGRSGFFWPIPGAESTLDAFEAQTAVAGRDERIRGLVAALRAARACLVEHVDCSEPQCRAEIAKALAD
jgi:hypothetical protein